MRKGKQRRAFEETLKSKSKSLFSDQIKQEDEDAEIEEKENKEQKGFFGCYLLTSISPRHKGHTYIGFTVNPKRRIRQHNGEIRCGARRTKSRRPWEMVLCIYGFPTNVAALQFEWAWQHPTESVAMRQAAVTFKSFSGVANKIKLAHTMLNLPNWQSMNITVNYFSTKYSSHSASCPSLPVHMKVQVCAMDELPCYSGSDDSSMIDDEDSLDCEDRDEEVSDRIRSFEDDSFTDAAIDNSANYSHCNVDPHEQFQKEQASVSPSLEVDYRYALYTIDQQGGTSSSIPTHADKSNSDGLGWQGNEQKTVEIYSDNEQQSWPRENQAANDEVGKEDQQRHCSSRVYKDVELIDCRQAFYSIDQLAGTTSSSVPSHADNSDGSRRQRNEQNSVEINSDDDDQQSWPKEKISANDEVGKEEWQRIHSSHVFKDVELIDLLTPSPNCRDMSWSKKRKITSVSPVIIDLT